MSPVGRVRHTGLLSTVVVLSVLSSVLISLISGLLGPAERAHARAPGHRYVGWCVGGTRDGYGVILHSVDGGRTWNRQGTPASIPDVGLESAAAVDADSCWVVGANVDGYGTILRTNDGGRTWVRQGTPASIPDVGLAKISAVDGNTAWVVGGEGTVLFTGDGGLNWAARNTADVPEVWLQGVYALNADSVWVTGDRDSGYGTICRTTDGGATWQRKGSAADIPDVQMQDVHAVDENTAWVACQGNPSEEFHSVLRTDDNGDSWTGKALGAGFFDTNSLTTVGRNTVWVVKDADGIFRTDNGWDFVQQQAAGGSYDYYLLSIDALDGDTAWVCGASGTNHGIIEHTTDAGSEWVKQLEYDAGLSGISFVEVPDLATWYLAEGTNAWGFDTYITIENPNNQDVTARLTYMDPQPSSGDGVVGTRDVMLPPLSQTTVSSTADIGPVDFSTKVECLQGRPIAVDRTMFWTGEGAPSPGYHSSVGTTTPSKTWYLPEGTSAWGFETWTSVLNPNDTQASLTLTYMTEAEGPRTLNKTIPPNSRATYSMVEDIGAHDASTKVESDIPVVAERSMYRGSRREGSCSIGAAAPSNDCFLAEGAVGYDSGFTTYVLVQNSNDETNDVALTYQTAAGAVPGPTFTMEPNSRKTVKVNEDLPTDTDVSTQVHGSKPLIAERAVYWNSSAGEAFHASTGLAFPHMSFMLPDGQTSNGFETYTCVQNPNGTPVEVTMTYFPAGGGTPVTRIEHIPAKTRKTCNMLEHSGVNGRASIMVRSNITGKSVIVERAMYCNSRGAGTGTIGAASD